MTLTIRRANFHNPGLKIFPEAHLADMAPLSPPESRHGLDMAALQKPTQVTVPQGTTAQLRVGPLDEQLAPGKHERFYAAATVAS